MDKDVRGLWRSWAIALGAACCCASNPAASEGAANAPQPPYRAPFVPVDDAQALQEVPAGTDPTVRQMHDLRGELDADRGNLALAEKLSQTYIDFGRRIGDAHYVGYAEAVLSPWLGHTLPSASVLVQYATILQYRHQFAEARVQLKRALVAEP